MKTTEQIVDILERVYRHGERHNTEVIDLPDDEITIEEGKEQIEKLIQAQREELIREIEEMKKRLEDMGEGYVSDEYNAMDFADDLLSTLKHKER